MTRFVIYGILGFPLGALITVAIFGPTTPLTTALFGAGIGLAVIIPLAVYLNRKNASYQAVLPPLSEIARTDQEVFWFNTVGFYCGIYCIFGLALVTSVPIIKRFFLESGWGILAFSLMGTALGFGTAYIRLAARKKMIANGIRPGFW